jgi:restriction endonuclease Mrr
MHAVVRRYSGQGAKELFDALEGKKGEVEKLIRGVKGFVAYSLIRTGDGGISVTVCQDKAGTDESVRIAADWVKQNVPAAITPPEISEGDTILQLG